MKIGVACQPNTETFSEAVSKAIELCQNLKEYKLYFVHCVAKNASSSLPYLDRLNRAYNMEIEEHASREVRELLEELDEMTRRANLEYEFVEIEKAENVEEQLQEFVNVFKPDLLYVGIRTASTHMLSKLVLGSISQFCVDKLPCPVVVVKPAHFASTEPDQQQQ